ncbi:zinc finger protein 875-like [Hyla sarda]|uniref:zinc finger protein 875-like n=1 Tax=Hyla sarda TaxID=327740 RepID=UPI0024C25088|nr:zinc finger protein 875-like [Hyla sarda]
MHRRRLNELALGLCGHCHPHRQQCLLSGFRPKNELVTFDDLAVYFPVEEWGILEKWQKDLYQEVMVELYRILLSVGLMTVTPEIILRIMMGEEPVVKQKSGACVTAPEAPAPGDAPLLQIILDTNSRDVFIRGDYLAPENCFTHYPPPADGALESQTGRGS